MTVVKVHKYPALDSEAKSVREYANNILKIPVVDVRKNDLYVFDMQLQPYSAEFIGRELLADKVSQIYSIQNLGESPMIQAAFDEKHIGNWGVRFAYKTDPLMRDDFGLNAKEAIEDLDKALKSLDQQRMKRIFGIDIIPDLTVGEIRRVQEYLFFGNLNFADIQKINHHHLSDVKVHDSIYFVHCD